MNKKKHKSIISKTILKLMSKEGISEAELSRRTGLKQTTVHRILSGKTTSPRIQSLQPIASYFGCSVNSILSEDDTIDDNKNYNVAHQFEVPLLEMTPQYLMNPNKIITNDFIVTGAKISKTAFAVKMNDSSMEMVFSKGTVLIVDPQKEISDRAFILVYLNSQATVICRQIIINGKEKYIKSMSPDLSDISMLKLEDKDKILGTIIQSITAF